jgi:hypothetical protein
MRGILSIACILLLALAPTVHAQSNKPDSASYETKRDSVVYITRHGKAYHRANCRFLTKSRIPLPLSEAKKYYSPYKVCKPPE